jgi:hypothetical protein
MSDHKIFVYSFVEGQKQLRGKLVVKGGREAAEKKLTEYGIKWTTLEEQGAEPPPAEAKMINDTLDALSKPIPLAAAAVPASVSAPIPAKKEPRRIEVFVFGEYSEIYQKLGFLLIERAGKIMNFKMITDAHGKVVIGMVVEANYVEDAK